MLEIFLEAQGARPNFRYDIIQPLLQGRAPIEGAVIRPSGATDAAGFFDHPKFKAGEFGLLDINMGDVIPAIDAGWDLRCLPVFVKRKPVYNYLWVRTDRGIDAPKDLEGKTLGTVGYSSAISIFTRGFLKDFYGVDLAQLRWLVNSPGPFEIFRPAVRIEQATGAPKGAAQRLLDGEIDASTGDITDLKLWNRLESSGEVKHLFADYQAENRALLEHRGIYTPVHILVIGGALERAEPGIARRVFDAFEQSRQIAYDDAMSDATGYSIKTGLRELMRDEVAEHGQIFTHGVAKNRTTIDLFLDYCADQGVTRQRLALDQFFAAGTIET